MYGAHYADPFIGAELSGQSRARASSSISAAVHAGQARRFALHILPDRQAQRAGPVAEFKRGKRMQVQIGRAAPRRLQDGKIGAPVIIGMDAPLQARLGRAARPGFGGAARDFRIVHQIRRGAQLGRDAALGKGAKPP